MRLLILGLLALGAHGHSNSYRSNLLSYAPARGEFPVQSELAQGYLRYLDNTGAERLVGFNYPEPLHGVRSESYNQKETQQQQLSSFRAWCEQRYNALRVELERLRAEGKQPSANFLSQYEPLEQILKTNALEFKPAQTPIPVQETAEVLRAREEHLRLYNEALQLAQAPTLKTRDNFETPAAPQQPLLQQQPQVPLAQAPQIPLAPQPAQAPLAPQAPQAPLAPQQPLPPLLPQPPQAPPALQAPLPVEDTPEVKRAREEHLKQYNEELLRQSAEAQQQPLAPLPTAAAKITKSEPYTPLAQKQSQPIALLPDVTLKSSFPNALPLAPIPMKNIHEQKIQLLNLSKVKAEDKVADIEDRIRYEERERDAERYREMELRREEQKQAELEREREQIRELEERQLLEAERIALQLQEQQRLESERLQESKRLQAEQQIIFTVDNAPIQPSNSYKLIAPTPVKPQTQPQAAQPLAQPQSIAQQQQVQNGFFLRIQAGQQSADPIPETIAQNPFLIRYIQQPQPQQQAQFKVIGAPSASSSIASSSSISSSSSSSSSSSLTSSNSISDLEKATREHFKAHEIALEQLRLANLKNPETNPIPCDHNH